MTTERQKYVVFTRNIKNMYYKYIQYIYKQFFPKLKKKKNIIFESTYT